MVTEAALATAAAAGAAEGAGAVAAGAGASAAGAGAAGAASAGAASGAGATAAGGASASGASAGAGAASGASASGASTAGATGAGATTTGAASAEGAKDTTVGAATTEGATETGAETSGAVSDSATETGSKKKGFKEWSDNVLDKYNQLHGGDADGWKDKSVWEKVGTTLNNAYTDYSIGSAAVNKITPPNAGVPGGLQAPQVQTVQQVSSDEKLKDVISEDVDPIDCFAQIDSYLYRYKPEVVERYNGHENGSPVNDDQNFGVMAQDLQANPLTAPAVKEDENGYLMLDGGRLSSINTAMIAELCKKVQELEEYIYGRK